MGIANQDGGALETVELTTVAGTTGASEAVGSSVVDETIGVSGPLGAD